MQSPILCSWLLILASFTVICLSVPPPLIGASLSWEVHRSFTSGTRIVTFFLRSSYDVTSFSECQLLQLGDASSIGLRLSSTCTSINVGQQFGRLCFDQFSFFTTLVDKDETCSVNGADNNFMIKNFDSDSIRPKKVVYGELEVNFTVATKYNRLLASLARNDTTIPSFSDSMYSTSYWTELPWKPSGVRRPACATVLRLCDSSIFPCSNGTFRPPNYFSPNTFLPLVVPTPGVNIPLKAFDYDGHPMALRTEFSASVRVSYENMTDLMISADATLPGFFDLATEPRTSPAGSRGRRGPMYNLTIAPSTGLRTVEGFIAVSDTVYDVLESGTSATSFVSTSRWQAGSAIVGTVYTAVRPEPGCSFTNTPAFLGPTDTEVFCSYAATQAGLCQVKVIAQVSDTTTGNNAVMVKVLDAVGFAGLPSGSAICSSSSCAAACDQGSVNCPCCCPTASRKECLFALSAKTVADVGRFFVQCFSAIATSPADDVCLASPLCVKFHVYGSRPRFVDPTPMDANSEDDQGILVRGRTDVPACLGYPLQLPLKAVDDDEGDQVRIYVEDKFNPTVASASAPSRLSSNFFFQGTPAVPFVQPIAGQGCGSDGALWRPFAAKRQGDNAQQASVQTMDPARTGVAAPYAAGVNYSLPGAGAAQNISFALSCNRTNGVACGLGPPYQMNLNPVVCGYAYDASRRRYGRWVGARNPDRPSAGFLADHSLGDYASDLHCWRIKLQAPPEIAAVDVTYQGGLATPSVLPASLGDAGPQGGGVVFDLSVGTEYEINFYGADPNPSDSVVVFLVGDTGLPEGAVIKGSPCVAQTRCQSQDSVPTGAYVPTASPPTPAFYSTTSDTPFTARCASANLTVRWNVTIEHAGSSFRLCAVARDDSSLCYGQGPPDATSYGWYGAERCAEMRVPLPALRWVGPGEDAARVGAPADALAGRYTAFVGCRLSIRAALVQLLPPNGAVLELAAGAPSGAVLADPGLAGYCLPPPPAALSTAVREAAALGLCRRPVTVQFQPPRGSEGGVFQLCLVASNAPAGSSQRVSAYDGYCQPPPGANWTGLPCRVADGPAACAAAADEAGLAGDAAAAAAAATCRAVCSVVAVARCRYCVREAPPDAALSASDAAATGGALWTLRALLGIDTDWLRLWTLNGDTAEGLGLGGACIPQLDCFAAPARSRVVEGPELALPAGGGPNKTVVWAGSLVSAQARTLGDLEALAMRFRTTTRSLLSLNPDIAADLLPAAAPPAAAAAWGGAAPPPREVCVVAGAS